MLPLRDTHPSSNRPIVTYAVIFLNVLVFLFVSLHGKDFNAFLSLYGLIPARYSVPQVAAHFTLWEQTFSFVSYMFLHADIWHLLGNMWSLYIFGDNIEDRLGPVRFLLFYLLCGMVSGLVHLLLNWHSAVPTVGASGAIAGVMGAYLLLFPKARILTLVPIFFLPLFAEIPAYVFLGIWFLVQFLGAAGASGGAGIAWWAHVGGFLAGMLLVRLLLRPPPSQQAEDLPTKLRRTASPWLQNIHVRSHPDDPDAYGTLFVTPQEAHFGTRKLVNIPWGGQSRLHTVAVPPRVDDGAVLRMRGMGKRRYPEGRGDLYLTVKIG